MSSPPEEPELKAGHPPAVKAGGKRIATKHHHPPPPPVPTPEERAENEEYEDTTLREKDNTKLIISGVVTKGNADFTSEAVKVAHEKPMPQHDKRPPAHSGGKAGNIHIQQPRKH